MERCFYEDPEGREICPIGITSAVLTGGAGQYLCRPVRRCVVAVHRVSRCGRRIHRRCPWNNDMCVAVVSNLQDVATHYCTVMCTDGRINWNAHEVKYCTENPDNCPPRPAIVPVAEYKLKPWSQVVRPPMQCTLPASGMPKITVVILAYKEAESLTASLDTYEKAGFFKVRHLDPLPLRMTARERACVSGGQPTVSCSRVVRDAGSGALVFAAFWSGFVSTLMKQSCT